MRNSQHIHQASYTVKIPNTQTHDETKPIHVRVHAQQTHTELQVEEVRWWRQETNRPGGMSSSITPEERQTVDSSVYLVCITRLMFQHRPLYDMQRRRLLRGSIVTRTCGIH